MITPAGSVAGDPGQSSVAPPPSIVTWNTATPRGSTGPRAQAEAKMGAATALGSRPDTQGPTALGEAPVV